MDQFITTLYIFSMSGLKYRQKQKNIPETHPPLLGPVLARPEYVNVVSVSRHLLVGAASEHLDRYHEAKVATCSQKKRAFTTMERSRKTKVVTRAKKNGYEQRRQHR